jgi:hypothetical protein
LTFSFLLCLAILAFNQTRLYFYAYYVAKTLTAMVSEGVMMDSLDGHWFASQAQQLVG